MEEKRKKDGLATCADCEKHANEKKEPVPYMAHETILARMERQTKRLWILCIIIFLAFVFSNAGWIWYESQFEDTVTTVTQDLDSGEGGNAIINDGVHINGESETDSNNTDTPSKNRRQ